MQVLFLFSDAHVVSEGFLELMNNILTSGMVPNLFHEEEKEKLRMAVRDEVMALFISKHPCLHHPMPSSYAGCFDRVRGLL